MINHIFREYETLFREISPRPRAALEVGAIPDSRCLLTSQTVADVPERVGLNLHASGDVDGVKVIQGDARDMPFEDGAFDLIVSSSTLEHIPDFWRACDEIRRVLAPGGLVIINVPGYGETPLGQKFRRLGFKLGLPDIFKRATPTFCVHDAPHDYYRFSRYAFEDVILKGLTEIEVWSVLRPPRIFGRGRKPG